MHSLEPGYLASRTFTPNQLSTLRQLGEHRGRQELFNRQRPEVLEALRTAAVIESTESSNRLEGITASRNRLREIVLKSTTPRNRSEQEIAGYPDALNLLHESAMEMPFSVGIVLQLHALLYRYHPSDGGRWKATDNEIVEREQDGQIRRVRFKPTGAIATPQAMADLTKRYKNVTHSVTHEPLVLIPITILDFLCVHPFQDGNGRMARLVTLQLLYHSQYEVGRYISLERIFEKSRDTYYETLEASSHGWHDGRHDVSPWMNYFWGVLLRAYDEFEARAGKIGGGRGAKSDQVRRAVERRVAPFRISDLETECPGVSRDTIRHALRRMRDEGLVVAKGTGRGARWQRILDAD